MGRARTFASAVRAALGRRSTDKILINLFNLIPTTGPSAIELRLGERASGANWQRPFTALAWAAFELPISLASAPKRSRGLGAGVFLAASYCHCCRLEAIDSSFWSSGRVGVGERKNKRLPWAQKKQLIRFRNQADNLARARSVSLVRPSDFFSTQLKLLAQIEIAASWPERLVMIIFNLLL